MTEGHNKYSVKYQHNNYKLVLPKAKEKELSICTYNNLQAHIHTRWVSLYELFLVKRFTEVRPTFDNDSLAAAEMPTDFGG